MKIATWNVNGVRARQGQLEQWAASEQPDVLCLQEIKASPSQLPPSLLEMEGYWCCWHGERAYSGVGLHVRKASFPTPPVFTHPDFDFENRVITVALDQLTIASVYVPNGGKDFAAKIRFLGQMRALASRFQAEGRALIICGDLNVARTEMDVHPKECKPNAIGQLPEERELLEQVLEQGLVDLGRALDPDNDRLFTWWPPWRNLRARNIGWRLDYILASTAVAAKAVSCPSFREIGTSDHAPVVATFALD